MWEEKNMIISIYYKKDKMGSSKNKQVPLNFLNSTIYLNFD